ncbi:MAG: hypothetical protein OEZ06_24810 [Myxococcales bacterium]|nr:hypothetical protein [Myxococcales bacterium]
MSKPPKGRAGDSGDRAAASFGVSRRDFLRVTGVVGIRGLGIGPAVTWLIACDPDGGGGDDLIDASFISVTRPDDLLSLRFRFVGLERVDDVLEVVDDDARIIVEFPRQHFIEEAVDELDADVDGLPDPPLRSLISGVSRVAFRVPEGVESIPYSLSAILEAVQSYALAVSDNAKPPEPPPSPSLSAFIKPGLVVNAQNRVVVDAVASDDLSATERIQNRRALTASNALSQQEPSVVPAALPDSLDSLALAPKVPEAPGVDETSIELPFRLQMSPNHFGRFLHATEPVEGSDAWVELWHSRLAVALDDEAGTLVEGPHPMATARALWVRGQDFDPDDATAPTNFGNNEPFLQAITPQQRNDIVHQTSNYTLIGTKSGKHEPPQPVAVRRMMLSALGGWLDSHGSWVEKTEDATSPGAVVTIGWTHRATMGRDHYVRMVSEGHLYPWGHRAVYVQISERKIKPGLQTAFLFKRGFLVIKEPVKSYASNAGGVVEESLRQLPFSSLQFRALVTPNLDLPDDVEPGNLEDGMGLPPFRPSIHGELYRFPVNGIDRAGRIIPFDAGAIWVPGSPRHESWGPKKMSVTMLYDEEVSTNQLGGQRVALAESTGDETTFETHVMRFGHVDLEASETTSAGLGIPFVPILESADLAVEALRAFAGAESVLRYEFFPGYVSDGFGSGNAGEVFLQLADDGVLDVNFEQGGTDRAGGFLAPNMGIKGLSRTTGAVAGDLATVSAGSFDPAKFFDGALPKLFGTIPLTDIIDLGDLAGAPRFVSEALDEVDAIVGDLQRLEALLDELPSGTGIESLASSILSDLTTLFDQIADFDVDALFGNSGSLATLDADLAMLASLLESSGIPPSAVRLLGEAVARLREALAVVDSLEVALQAAAAAQELAKNQTVRFEFRPPIKGDSAGIFEPTGGLVLAAEIRAKAVGGKPAGADIICGLENFRINLIGTPDPAFSIHFERMQFIARAGQKPDVDVVLGEIVFGGPLAFIQRIKDIIPLDGFSDPPAIDVSPAGLAANFSVPLPNIAIGIFSLENLSIGAGFEIPFLGDAIGINFFFCTRENPFTLTVSMLGGGGFVGLQLSPEGVRLLEIALEFGASLSVDFGVASGGVSIMAGIYFAIEGDVPYLEGYLRIRGEVCVLGLISASIELYMSLAYEGATGKVIGRAEITIEVSVLCFSATVTVSAERKFAGSNGDPTFAEIMQPCDPPALPTDDCGSPTPWARYVNAFA